MKHMFYDVKIRQKVEAEITEKVTFGEASKLRYGFKAQTSDGRNLTAFVGRAKWDEAQV